MTFTWWEDAVAQATALAQWTDMKHTVKGIHVGNFWWWTVAPADVSLLEACS